VDAVVCLSVIEHGVPIDAFMAEMERILAPGGVLYLSSDYWSDPVVEAAGRTAYGQDIRIFTPAEFKVVVRAAEAHGLRPIGKVRYETGERVVKWERVGLDFTFIGAGFERVA
jgi:SAM-dependent methyltransferase